MQKWEYLTMAHIWDEERKVFYWQANKDDVEMVDEKLNKAGMDGWELVAVRTVAISNAFYTFKRPIE